MGLVGFRFNTIGVSDGMSMGTDGMSYSLQSRDLIADSIETVMSAQVCPTRLFLDRSLSTPFQLTKTQHAFAACHLATSRLVADHTGQVRSGMMGW